MLLAGRTHGIAPTEDTSQLYLFVVSDLWVTHLHLPRAQILARQLLDLQAMEMAERWIGMVIF